MIDAPEKGSITMKIVQLLLACSIFVIAFLAAFSSGSPWLYFTTGNPLHVSAVICGGIIAACFVLAWITGDYSQTDRLWSITPVSIHLVFRSPGPL